MTFYNDLSRVLRYGAEDTPASLVDKAVARQSGFTPTAENPYPQTNLTSEELDHWHEQLDRHSVSGDDHRAGDFHDWAAVLAGRKPAALIENTSFLTDHPVGQEMLRRSKEMGHKVHLLSDGGAVVGKPANVSFFRKTQQPFETDPQGVGRALGYPEAAVQRFGKVGFPGRIPGGPPKDATVVDYRPGMTPPTHAMTPDGSPPAGAKSGWSGRPIAKPVSPDGAGLKTFQYEPGLLPPTAAPAPTANKPPVAQPTGRKPS